MFIISAISYAKDVGDFIGLPLPTKLWKSQMGGITYYISLIISTNHSYEYYEQKNN